MDLKLFSPKGNIAADIQAIWSVRVSTGHREPIVRLLLGDAGSGILFNFGPEVFFDGIWHPPGIILLPISQTSQNIIMPPGTQMAGIRFHPAMGYQCLGKRFDSPVRSEQETDIHTLLNPLYLQLHTCSVHYTRIRTIYQFSRQHIVSRSESHQRVKEVLRYTHHKHAKETTLGLRQIERHFQSWMGMTPKYYQRVIRVKEALEQLQLAPSTSLAELAADFGFADQAHMTREFRTLANITPKHYARRYLVNALQAKNSPA
ncbi:helix-turn-helix domain-containing protein [Shewanella chilikensis]|uniref:AraC family transcriptional regulator n=1 Tax=Shewanella chilikensis TaxID=558541 RepID=UPI00399C1960